MGIFEQLGGYFKPEVLVKSSHKKQFIATSEKLMNSDLYLSTEDIAEMLFALSQNNDMGLTAEMVAEYTKRISQGAATIDCCLEAFTEVFETELV